MLFPYRSLVEGKNGQHPMSRFGWRIAPFDITTSLHTLALKLGVAPLSPEEQEEMLNTIVSYIVRRAICGLTPKNYNNVFVHYLRGLSKSGISLQVLRNALSLPRAMRSVNAATGIQKRCINAPLYPGRVDTPEMRAILTEIELELRKTVRTEAVIVCRTLANSILIT